jgi:CO/xanthine dehydrogenase FAD-binding subunit
MKPPLFSYVAPETVAECLELLRQYGSDAKIMAGGQSLMPLLALRMARPGVIIDIGRIKELDFVRRDGAVVRIGAGLRQRVIERDPIFAQDLPLLCQAVDFIGHVATRSRGTIVGSLCHADPAAELPVCATLLEAELVVASHRGERKVPAKQFFESALVTALKEDELVSEVRFPAQAAGSGFAFTEIARRHGDFAMVSAGAVVRRNGSQVDSSIALGGVGATPLVFGIADFSLGQGDNAASYKRTADAVMETLEPADDLHATAAYRRSLAGVLIERVLAAASQRAGVQR